MNLFTSSYSCQFQVYEDQTMEANAEISRQAQTISKLEQDLNRLDKSSDMTSKRLEAENNSLHLHLSKLEQQLLDAKLSYHDLQSNLKHTSNELVSSKQSQGTSSCVCILNSNYVVQSFYSFQSSCTFLKLLRQAILLFTNTRTAFSLFRPQKQQKPRLRPNFLDRNQRLPKKCRGQKLRLTS